MASSDDINIKIKVDTSDVPKAEQQVSTFEKMVEQAVSRMKQALSLKVDTAGLKEAMGAVKSLNGSLSSVKPNIKLAADTSGIQPAVSAVKNLESSVAKPVTVKTAANTTGIKPAVSAIDNLKNAVAKPVKVVTSAATSGIQSAMSAVNNLKSVAAKPVKVITSISGNASSAISAIKNNIASVPKKITSIVSANDGGTVSKLVSGFQTLGAKAKSVADGVMNIGTLARSSLPSVASGASSSSKALSSISPAANSAKKAVADIGKSAEDASGKASKLYDSLQKVAAVTMTGVATGIGFLGKKLKDVVKDSYDLLSTSEQVTGGVEALYGDAADSVKKNAKDAFKTAGMSANRYMDIATSLAAVMTSSVGGDSKEAARLMDMAVRDMSDNANKMGTDMESVIGTYQSLSRGNYAMLDNLKLGYGGTKAELHRLIADTNKYRDANNQLSADKFSDIAEAIHDTQERLHILGTTSKEAATTIEGSFNQMKAAWENFKTDLGKGDASQIQLDSQELVESFNIWVKRAKPAIIGIFKGLAQAIPSVFDDLEKTLPPKFQKVFSSLSKANDKNVKPLLASLGASFAAFGAGGIAPLLSKIPLIGGALSGLAGPLTSLSSPLGILLAGFTGLVAASPKLQKALGKEMTSSLETLKKPLGDVENSFGKLMGSLHDLIDKVMPLITEFIEKIIIPTLGGLVKTIGSGILYIINEVLKVLTKIIDGITKFVNENEPAIEEAIDTLSGSINKVLDSLNKILDGIKKFVEEKTPAIEQALGTIGSDISAFVELVQPLLDSLKKLVDAMYKKFIEEILPEIKKDLKDLGSTVGELFANIQGLIEALYPHIKWIVDIVSDLIENVLIPDLDDLTAIIKSGINLIKEWLDGLIKHISNVVKVITDILNGDWKKAWEDAKNTVNDDVESMKTISDSGKDVGKNLVKGLWNGIVTQNAWLAGKLAGWSKDVTDKVRASFVIGSPSKLFAREIGRFLPQGIAVGIDSDTDSVLDSLRRVKTKALNEVSDMRLMSTYTSYTPSNTDSYPKVPTYTITGNTGYSMPLLSNKSQNDSPYQSGQPVILQVNLNGKTIAKETYKDITYLQKRDTSRGM